MSNVELRILCYFISSNQISQNLITGLPHAGAAPFAIYIAYHSYEQRHRVIELALKQRYEHQNTARSITTFIIISVIFAGWLYSYMRTGA